MRAYMSDHSARERFIIANACDGTRSAEAVREAKGILIDTEPNVDPRGAGAVFVMPWYGEHAAVRHLWRPEREALREALADALDPEYAPDFATYLRQCQAEALLEG